MPRATAAAVLTCAGAQFSLAAAVTSFSAGRHPDTVDRLGPYRVKVQQRGGPKIAAGEVVFTVRDETGKRVADNRAPLEADGGAPGTWFAMIPGQPYGSTIVYHFVLRDAGGGKHRHPRQEGTGYRFRVLAMQLVSLDISRGDALGYGRASLELSVRAATRPEAELVVRVLPRRRQGPAELTLRPHVEPVPAGSASTPTFRLTCELPELNSGEIVDFYLRLRLPGHGSRTLPPDAPTTVYSFKRPLRRVQSLPSDPALPALGLSHGLPSGVIRFVLPDPVSGTTYVGTNRGVVALGAGESLLHLVRPSPSAWQREIVSGRGLRPRAGPAALSSLDGSILFQVQTGRGGEEGVSERTLFLYRDGHLREWSPTKAPDVLAGLWSARFDPDDGCWLLGAALRGNAQDLPAAVQVCGNEARTTPIRAFHPEGGRIVPERIIDVVRDPGSGDLVAGLELRVLAGGFERRGYGVYRLDRSTGTITPLRPETALFDTGFATLRVDRQSGSISIGETTGETQLFRRENEDPSPWSGRTGLPPDAVPTDVQPAGKRMLLVSHSRGLFEIERLENGLWTVIESSAPGREFPPGSFGEARYLKPEGFAAALHTRGLVLADTRGTRLLGPQDGLYGVHPLRLLARGPGRLWVSFTPQPFGSDAEAALQMLDGDRVVRTVEIGNRNLAAISRWVEVSERGTVFAATRSGVVEMKDDGSMQLLSHDSASAIARDPHTGSIGVIGSAVAAWNGERFDPVLFRVDHPRGPRGRFAPGPPIDLAIDRTGTWFLLFRDGVILLLSPAKPPISREARPRFETVGILDAEDGIPPASRRMLADPENGDVVVCGAQEGCVVVMAP